MENVGIIGILAYPKTSKKYIILEKFNEWTRCYWFDCTFITIKTSILFLQIQTENKQSF